MTRSVGRIAHATGRTVGELVRDFCDAHHPTASADFRRALGVLVDQAGEEFSRRREKVATFGGRKRRAVSR